jgi:hypothetical protein
LLPYVEQYQEHSKGHRGLRDLNTTNKTRGVSHCGLAIYIKKYLKAKEELWKLKSFTMQKCNLQNPLKETKILQAIITQ